jgi:hypothetical protein
MKRLPGWTKEEFDILIRIILFLLTMPQLDSLAEQSTPSRSFEMGFVNFTRKAIR